MTIWNLTAGFFRWWRAELYGLLPSGLRREPESRRARLVLSLGETSAVLARESGKDDRQVLAEFPVAALQGPVPQQPAGAALASRWRGEEAVVRLPAGSALRKVITLPSAARENLRQVIGFQLDRHTPFKPEQVYFDERLISSGADRIVVEITVVPRPVIESAAAAGRRIDLDVAAVEVADDRPGRSFSGNLLPVAARAPGVGRGALVTAGLAGLAALLLFLAVEIPLNRAGATAELLSSRLAAARQQAGAATRLRATLDSLEQDSRFLIDRKAAAPTASEILRELTGVLPDDTWLNQLQFSGTDLQISGFSVSASTLIGRIEESSLFHATEFRSPVTQDQRTGRERFQISTRVVKGKRP